MSLTTSCCYYLFLFFLVSFLLFCFVLSKTSIKIYHFYYYYYYYYYYISPFNNPTETYRYYSLPFCHEHSSVEEESEAAQEEDVDLPETTISEKRLGAQRHRQRLGESIVGDRRESSPYEISFDDSVEWRMLCKRHLLPVDVKKLKDAIHNNYFFEMFVEDLPMWGYIGDIIDEDLIVGELVDTGSKTYLFTHLNFIIGHNHNQIVSAKVTTDVSLLPVQ